jgi:YrbI family 3-deoxy-D-manno-octulosonate 8-phosphate phosphatase
MEERLTKAASRIKLLIVDVDGVLTDGSIVLDNEGNEIKFFHVRDGHGIKLLQRAGIEVAIVTGRESQVVNRRAEELGIKHVHQKSKNKIEAYESILKETGLKDEDVAYVGDDIVDIPVMKRVGLSAAVADAEDYVKVTPINNLLGLLIFIVAALTDTLDGYIARRTGQVTKFGIIMDPIADKILVIAALILLVDMARVSIWAAVIIIAREFIITGLRVVALSKDIVIAAELGGKLKTTTQMAAIICLIVGWREVLGIDLFDAGTVLLWISIVLSIISGVQYMVSFWRKISNQPS